MPKGYSLDAMGQMFYPINTGGLGSTDLNTLNSRDDVGVYVQPTSAAATLALNYPTQVAGTLEILPSANGVMQRYTRYANPHYTYTRAIYNGVWSDWDTFVPYAQLFNSIFPIGCEIMLSDKTDPNTKYPGTTWALINDNRVLRASSNPDNIGETGGADRVTLTVAQLPVHNHSMTHTHANGTAASAGAHTHAFSYTMTNTNNGHYGDTGYGGTRTTLSGTTGSAGAHTHDVSIPTFTGNTGNIGSGGEVQITNPYRRVAVWRRTA